MIKEESNKLILELIDQMEEWRGAYPWEKPDYWLEDAQNTLRRVLELEHNGKVFRKENGR